MNKNFTIRLLALFIGLFPLLLNAQSNCEALSIQTIDNELVVSGLAIGNTKARIYNNAYELVYACEFDCESNVTIPNVVSGEIYHLTFEFFTDNFDYIYQDKRDYTIGNSLLTIGLCKETLKLYTQTEVDNFCGCEIALNGMEIGNRFIPQLSDVSDISNLTGIRGVGGALIIWNTQLTSLTALSDLFVSRYIYINNNPLLEEINAFQEIEALGGVSLVGNSNLVQINGFQSLSTLTNVLAINSNASLTALNGFGQLTTTNIFQFENNDNFQSLTDFANLETIGNNFTITGNDALTNIEIPNLSGDIGNVFIGNNPQLQNLPAIGNFNVTSLLQIQNNPLLVDCCELSTLFDDDLNNGHSGGQLLLNDNGNLCNSTLDILENCGGTVPTSCEDILITSENNELTINVITAPISIIKVYDEAYQLVFECNNNCEETIRIADLNTCEQYTIDVQLYTENFELICERKFTTIVQGDLSENTACKGDIILQSQADVDDFCGCTRIEGSLYIGTDEDNNINDISNLSTVREVTDFLSIRRTQLTELSNLNVHKVGRSIDIVSNPILEVLAGFNEMEFLDWLNVQFNPSLKQIGGFQTASNIETISILSNDNLTEITGFDRLENMYNLNIDNNDALKEVVNFDQLINSTSQITITGNEALENIAFPKLKTTAIIAFNDNPNLTTVASFDNLVVSFELRIRGNTALSECCFLKELVDEDINNGYVGGEIDIQGNGAMCNSIAEIIANCTANPCDDGVCQGDVVLETQAAVDAFCGCEVIEGYLQIGRSGNTMVDITSLRALENLKIVKGSMAISNTQLEDLSGLQSLAAAETTLVLHENTNLKSFLGLGNLRKIGSLFIITENPNLTKTEGLNNLEELGGLISHNSGFKNLAFLGNLQNDQLSVLEILYSNNLTDLSGLEAITKVIGTSTISVLIAENNNLVDISALQNMTLIENGFVISNNPALNDCCSVTHLIDDDPNNGIVTGLNQIDRNANLCSSFEAIFQNCESTISNCETIQITTENSQLTISGIIAPNSIVKLFDKNYQLIYDCTSSDCEETITINDLIAGEIYHTDIQFYNKDWQFICEDRRDITIEDGIEPCDTSICAGNVILRTQAEVDAFCGCESIEGNVTIGYEPNNEDLFSDIVNVNSMAALKAIKGHLIIGRTDMTSISGLSQLKEVGSLILVANSALSSIDGFTQLDKIYDNFYTGDNPNLRSIDVLGNLTFLGSLNVFSGVFEKLPQFDRLENESFAQLIINQCSNLQSLQGLEKIKSIKGTATTNPVLEIFLNPMLTDISALQQIELVEGRFNISVNALLAECCAITHLVDDNPDNGIVNGEISIFGNPSTCNSAEEILANCVDQPLFSCDNINVTFVDNELSIQGLTAPIEIVKVFDEDWQMVYDCFGDCEDNITLPNLSDNIWRVQIANYDEDWNFLCHGDQDVNVAEDRRSNDFQAADFSLYPNPAYGAVVIDLKKVAALSVDLKIVNQFGQAVYQKSIEKVSTPKQKIDLTDFSNGLYFLQIKPKGKRPITKKIMVSNLY